MDHHPRRLHGVFLDSFCVDGDLVELEYVGTREVTRSVEAMTAGRPVRAIAVRKIVTMQDRYVGDIGDYLKLGILRALSPGYRIGIAWWPYPDESHNRDGRHIGYLHRPDQWRTMIQNCSMLWPRSYPRARGTFGHWKRPVFFPEQSMPGRWSLSVGHVRNVRGSVTDGSAGSNPLLRTPISCSLTQTMDLSLRVPRRQARASCSPNFMD